jgi:hypothetical protein
MSIYRKWYCTCTGKPVELGSKELLEDEPLEPACEICGATPSSDPKKTIIYREIEDWDD